MIKTISIIFSCIIALSSFNDANAQTLPKPKHIVVAIDENQAYEAIIGSTSAPYINSLLKDSNCATFSNMYANSTAASQPNYLYLFSGADQGVTSNAISSKTPFTTCNLGASLIAAGKSFTEYSEGLPSVGYLGTTSGYYDRKHNPVTNWQGTLSNNVPATCNQPFSAFPTNYDSLPTISFVVPNEVDNMHSSTIQNGDNWLKANLDKYIAWTKKNNSMFIFTFDEDDGNHGNHIVLLIIGPMVKGGNYTSSLNFLHLLRTMEDIYGLPSCGGSAGVSAISNIYTKTNLSIEANNTNGQQVTLYPNPAHGVFHLKMNLTETDDAIVSIKDISGKIVMQKNVSLIGGLNDLTINMEAEKSGMYFLTATGKNLNYAQKIVIQ